MWRQNRTNYFTYFSNEADDAFTNDLRAGKTRTLRFEQQRPQNSVQIFNFVVSVDLIG